MSDVILHHYPLSPYSEKVRLGLGLKGLSYHSVTVPVWMPKPDLMPLTGGYRRTPVIQVGSDIYCDTPLILQVIDRMHPKPSFYPGGSAGLASAVSWWVEKTVWLPAIYLTTSLIGDHLPAELVEERKPFFGADISKAATLRDQALNRQRLHAHLTWAAQMMQDGRRFLLGDAPSAVDLAAYHPIWFVVQNAGQAGEAMLPMAPLRDWYGRVAALGHGKPSEMSGADALAVASKSEPAAPAFESEANDPSGCAPGDRVSVTADDYGRDPVVGELVACGPEEMVVRRVDPAAGTVHVHFPRAGFELARAERRSERAAA